MSKEIHIHIHINLGDTQNVSVESEEPETKDSEVPEAHGGVGFHVGVDPYIEELTEGAPIGPIVDKK